MCMCVCAAMLLEFHILAIRIACACLAATSLRADAPAHPRSRGRVGGGAAAEGLWRMYSAAASFHTNTTCLSVYEFEYTLWVCLSERLEEGERSRDLEAS